MLPIEVISPLEQEAISRFPSEIKTPAIELKHSELLCRIQYSNKLPDIPFDLKFLIFPFKSARFSKYTQSSLERNHKYEFLTDYSMGIEVDLTNVEQYESEESEVQLHPDDEKLLEDDYLTLPESKRSINHAKSVSWLRRTEYISTETTRFQPQNADKMEAKVGGFSIKKYIAEGLVYLDHENQIKAIEKTFEDSKKPIEQHHSKRNVYPVQILPVYPDFELWKHPCAQVIFDADPTPPGYSLSQQMEIMSQAMLRGVMDENEEQFVAYFIPTDETLEKRKKDKEMGLDYRDDESYEYRMYKEYNWNVKSKTTEGYEENYFMVLRDDGLYYNELETRVRLNKRRRQAGDHLSCTKLIVKHRQLNSHELKVQESRARQLKSLTSDDVEDNDDHSEANKNEQKEKNEHDDDKRSDQSSQPCSRETRSRSLSSSKSARSGSPASTKSERSSSSVEHVPISNGYHSDNDVENDLGRNNVDNNVNDSESE
ncbi:RNA polymerase II-associated factor 1 homolog [Microplitis demolitor]|uniref:RNA polymerase II-associated factor 1 homolog n=1 Tax=Microplitis demolitor TaxID=69319 RepID=UPI0006D4CE55|nr:RNA polymerase II-associated factor 1 homolog [Microplitis demolitor]